MLGWKTARAERQAAQFVGQGIAPVKPTLEFSFEGLAFSRRRTRGDSKLNRRARSTEGQTGPSVAQ